MKSHHTNYFNPLPLSRCSASHSRARCRGISLLEVSIASIMSVMVVLGATSFCHTMVRTLSDTIAQTRQAIDTRIVVEALRRDFAGALPDDRTGSIDRWKLVGRQIVADTELRLCYDGNEDGIANWASPDRIVRYVFSDDKLQRIDSLTGTTLTIADQLGSVEFQLSGGQIRVLVSTAVNAFPAQYQVSAPDIS